MAVSSTWEIIPLNGQLSGSEACYPSGAGRSVGSSSLGSDSFSSDEALSVGMGGVTGFFSATSNMVRSNRSPFSIRGAMHLWSSWTALHNIPGSVPDFMAHHWRAWASATISSCLTIQMSLMPWNSVGGRKSFCLNTPRLGRALHQPICSSWTNGRLKATACQLARSLTWMSLRGTAPKQQMDQNYCHQSGTFLLFLT